MLSVIDIYNFFICCKANLFIIGNAKQVEFTVLLIKMFLNTNAALFLVLLLDCEYLFILSLWKKLVNWYQVANIHVRKKYPQSSLYISVKTFKSCVQLAHLELSINDINELVFAGIYLIWNFLEFF